MSATAQISRLENPAREWLALARVMTLSAACALASGLLSAVSAKLIALAAGPAAIGLLASLQQIRETALNAATANGGSAVVQGASSLQGRARREFLRTAAIVFGAATAVATGFLCLAPSGAARAAGLSASYSRLLPAVAAAVVFGSLYVFLGAVLNALGAAHRLAWLQLASPGAMAVLAWPAARGGWFGWLLAAAAAVSVFFAALALWPDRARLAAWLRGAGRIWSGEAARGFFSISGAMLAASLAGSAALLAVRANIVRREGLAQAGQFDAAWNLSMNQVSLVLASLQTHYLPTLARLKSARERGAAVGRVLALAAPASAGIIAVLAGSKHFWLTLFYSAQFHPAAAYLRWTLAGDYLKAAGWIFSIPLLALADLRAFLAADLAACAVFVAAAFGLARWGTPAEAAAIGFVLMNAAHLAIGAFYVWRRHGFHLMGPAPAVWLTGLAVVAGVSLWKWNA